MDQASPDAVTEQIVRMAEVMVAVMRDLIDRGRARPEEIEAMIMQRLIPDARAPADLVQQMLMQRVLLSLAELFPRSGRA